MLLDHGGGLVGESLKPIIGALKHWGEAYLQRSAAKEAPPRRNLRSLSGADAKTHTRERAARR